MIMTDCGDFCSRGRTSDLAVSINSCSELGQWSCKTILNHSYSTSSRSKTETEGRLLKTGGEGPCLDAAGRQHEQALDGLPAEALHPVGIHHLPQPILLGPNPKPYTSNVSARSASSKMEGGSPATTSTQTLNVPPRGGTGTTINLASGEREGDGEGCGP